MVKQKHSLFIVSFPIELSKKYLALSDLPGTLSSHQVSHNQKFPHQTDNFPEVCVRASLENVWPRIR